MEKIGVIGCGTMGHSIALGAALTGFEVVMYGVNEEELSRAIKGISVKVSFLYDHDIVNESEHTIKSRVKTTTSLESAVEEATFVIEAAPEQIELKKDLFKKLDQLCGASVVLASNTSGLSPNEISSDMLQPERAIVTHFWNPAHLIPLVEIVPGNKTNEETITRSMDLMNTMKKKPIKVNKDIPGFVGNRLQYALFREAQYLLEEGVASKEDIDAAVTYSIGRRLPVTGPLMTADMGGLDVFTAISDYLFSDLCIAGSSLSIPSQLAKEGKLGDKSGEGFYYWDSDFSEEMNQRREQELIHFLKKDLGIS